MYCACAQETRHVCNFMRASQSYAVSMPITEADMEFQAEDILMGTDGFQFTEYAVPKALEVLFGSIEIDQIGRGVLNAECRGDSLQD